MKGIIRLCLICCLFLSSFTEAQRGKDGALTVSSTLYINEYTALTANAAIGNTSITVANSALNSNSRFAGNLSPGDLVMIIQMQGASILSHVYDSTWGSITSYNNCGLYELREVLSVPNSTTINFTCPLINNYSDTGSVQVVRVPRYSTVAVNAGGVITADAWNGQTGGIIAAEVLGSTSINGSINADTLGFRGGQLVNMSGASHSVYNFDSSAHNGGEKGEGIAGFEASYTIYGGPYCRGAAANGGGGGDAWNTAGGGGGNGGNVAGYNGNGNPDVSNPSWIAAWNLEYSGFATNISSGGGRGGYGTGGNSGNPLTEGPGNPAWGTWLRLNTGGKGGRPLDYSTGRLFLGGGGGTGHEDNNHGGPGGNGGGLIYLIIYGTVSGTGQVTSNGANGGSNYAAPQGDGSGGGGAGGTIIINATGAISGITTQANGGKGGSQYITSSTENEGPAGGGGGGYIATSNTITTSVLGGINGTTNASTMTAFVPDGGTQGGPGSTGTVTDFIIVSKNDTICTNTTATLTASLSGTVPVGTTIEWSNSSITGTYLGSGATFTTPPLSATTIFYVSTCPGDYSVPDTVFVKAVIPIITNVSDTICSGNSITLTASGGSIYKWSTGATTSSVSVSPTTTTTYTAYISGVCDSGIMTAKVNVFPSPLVSISQPSVCLYSLVVLKANATGTGPFTYVWSPGGQTNDSISVLDSNQTYTVTVTGAHGCTVKNAITLTANIPVLFACCNKTIFMGDDTIIVAGGDSIKSYSWSPSVVCLDPPLCDTVKVSPTVTTTYTVTGTNDLGCETNRVVTIIVEAPCFDLKVPNVFTPNYAGVLGSNGGTNNIFYIETKNITGWSTLIYDRWGKEMFKTTDPNKYWDGNTESGSKAPDGVYYYIISGTCNNNTYKKDGFLQLIR